MLGKAAVVVGRWKNDLGWVAADQEEGGTHAEAGEDGPAPRAATSDAPAAEPPRPAAASGPGAKLAAVCARIKDRITARRAEQARAWEPAPSRTAARVQQMGSRAQVAREGVLEADTTAHHMEESGSGDNKRRRTGERADAAEPATPAPPKPQNGGGEKRRHQDGIEPACARDERAEASATRRRLQIEEHRGSRAAGAKKRDANGGSTEAKVSRKLRKNEGGDACSTAQVAAATVPMESMNGKGNE